jgi:hypothetical protein
MRAQVDDAEITLAEVEKLGRVHAVEPIVLSVYLNVPRSPAELPGLPGRVDELVAAAVYLAAGLVIGAWILTAVTLRPSARTQRAP